MWLFYQFTFERNYDVLKAKNPCILLNKKQNGIENRKSYTVLQRRIVFELIQEPQIKCKTVIVGARKEKKDIFCNVYFVRRNFFNICALSQSTVYLIHFQNIHTFTYQKTILHTHFFLFLKS